MKVSIEIPEEYIKQYNKTIKNKELKDYIEEHIISVLEITCPVNKGFWKQLITWSF